MSGHGRQQAGDDGDDEEGVHGVAGEGGRRWAGSNRDRGGMGGGTEARCTVCGVDGNENGKSGGGSGLGLCCG